MVERTEPGEPPPAAKKVMRWLSGEELAMATFALRYASAQFKDGDGTEARPFSQYTPAEMQALADRLETGL